MLEDFVEANRRAILNEPLAGGARESNLSRFDAQHGIPEFLNQLAEVLRHEKAAEPIDLERLTVSAGEHGRALLELGLTMRQVVQEYASVFQTISGLALQQNVVIPPSELRTLNLCINDAIAEATTTYALSREQTLIARATEHLGSLAHELRNVLNVAVLSFEGIKSGRMPANGSVSRS